VRPGSSSLIDTRIIYCGDCLDQLRKLPAECVDLIYIDPPFNSNRNYEVFWGETKEKRAFEDRHASTAAYIDFMRPRCVELARVLKKTGSFYYHCDWHASHYVKVMLDQIFGENNFQNEIVWKRSASHTDARQGSKHFGRLHDVVLFYSGGSDDYTWNQLYLPLSSEYVDSHYSNIDADGRHYMWDNLTGPGGAAKGNAFYEVLGVKGYWRYSREKMDDLIKSGRVAIPPRGKTPRLKRYLDQSKGVAIQTVWDDLPPVNSQAKESRGYPTQKPVGLLERIVKASSNPDDIVLDAFCTCGTSLVAAKTQGVSGSELTCPPPPAES
jgi:site-specific DNA-methyltransferase (adenine-specific)